MKDPTMRAAVYRRPGEIDVIAVPAPVATDDRILVAVDFCGICGTDLHMVVDGWGTPDSVFGHEWSGRVVDPGPSDLARGARVVGQLAIECGSCDRCRAGRPSLCLMRSAAGSGPEQGAFAELISLDPAQLVPVPAGVDARAAAYTEPLAVALHAITLSGIADGDRALVFGAGPIGAAIIAVLRIRGVAVTAVEPGRLRAELATRLGAVVRPEADLSSVGHPGEAATDAVEVVFETSGARTAAEVGLTQLVSAGVLMLVGTGLDRPRFDGNRIILNELRVMGAFNYDADGFRTALDLIASEVLPLDLLIEPDTVGLDQLLTAMQRLKAGDLPGKVMVTP